MYFADAPPDESLGETDCCGFNVFNVYSVAVQTDIYIYIYIYIYMCVCASLPTPRSAKSAIGDSRSSEGSLYYHNWLF